MRRTGQCARYSCSALGTISAVASEIIAVDLPVFALTGTRHSAGFNSGAGTLLGSVLLGHSAA
ncbi:hypothetical protein Rwratislav_27714 [Rhodococcus wratislaviensis IFP 2016]|nr:hypothetical protein Rwratislav_27714 [Rhodococcus wratislaviensis IFP 2016]